MRSAGPAAGCLAATVIVSVAAVLLAILIFAYAMAVGPDL